MRNNQNKRMRGRGGNNGGGGMGRKSHNPLTRVFESNGPDIKIRGTPNHIAEKYIQLARDAQSSGDPVAAENYYQHAEHYFRLIAAAQEQFRQSQPQFYRPENDVRSEETFDDADEAGLGAQGGGNDAPYGAREPQPYPPRENQPYHGREPQQAQPREHQQSQPREHQPRAQQPGQGDAGGENGALPSFITGGPSQAPVNAQPMHEGAPDRFPLHRGRRRYRGPRPDMQAGQAPAPASAPEGE